MSEVREKRQYMIIHHAISVLTTLCCGDVNTTIDLLTGYLWDEEEAGHIKQALAELEAGYCSGCLGKTIHHTCGKEPDADKVQAEQSKPDPGFEICEFCGCHNNKLCMRTCCDRGRKADELAGKNKCRHCGASRVTRPSGEWQFACKCDDPEKRHTKPEEFTAKCCHPGVNPQKFDKLSWREVLCDLACPLIDRQAKQLKEKGDYGYSQSVVDALQQLLKDKHTISKEDAKFLRGVSSENIDLKVQLAAQANEKERLKIGLTGVQSWVNAYFLDVFPKPDLKKAAKALEENGMTLDAINADAVRGALDGIKGIVEQALKGKE